MFKLGMSLVLGVVAALVIILVGLLGDARLLTILGRALVGFLVAGVFTYLVTFMLEATRVVGFDKNFELIEPEDGEEPKSVEEYEEADAEAETAEDATADAESEDGAEFTPLAGTLRHMEAPPEQ